MASKTKRKKEKKKEEEGKRFKEKIRKGSLNHTKKEKRKNVKLKI